MAIHPALGVIRRMKIAENSIDYSLNNTARQVLWLPTTADMKYRAKTTTDTLFVRAGDGLAALTAFVGDKLLGAPLRSLFALNAALVVVWLAFAAMLIKDHRRVSAQTAGAP
jgi:AAA family ATP:ADP antiporter